MSAKPRGAATWVAAIVTLGIAVLIAACGSSTSTSNTSPSNVTTAPASSATPSTTTPGTPTSPASPSATKTTASVSAATCQHARRLQASLTSLTHVQFNASSAGQITKDLKSIQTQLAALKNAPGFQAHAQQLSSSLNQVKKAAQGLGTSPSPGQVGSIVTALSGLRAQAGATMSQLRQLCP